MTTERYAHLAPEVLVAAHARMRVAQGTSVGTRELAALAGLSQRQVGVLARDREIPGAHGSPASVQFRAAGAAQWLSARGVEGFARKP